MEIGYWNTRGLAAPMRYALHHVGATFNDRTFELTGDFEKGFDNTEWASVKETLSLDFPNNPYLIDGDVRLTQTNTILRYLARKYNLFGNDFAGQLDVEQSLDALTEIKDAVIDICYARKLDKSIDFKDNKERFAAFIPFFKQKFATMLTRFEEKLGKDETPFLCAGVLTMADFVLFEETDVLATMFGDAFLTPRLAAHRQMVAALPGVAAYRATEGYKKQPINNWCAIWKGQMDGVIDC